MAIELMEVLAPIASYLVGSIPFGFIVAKAKGVDIRQQGSGNVGATNVGRVLGRKFGILVFVLDFFKGVIPCALAVWWRHGQSDMVAILVGLLAVLGHMFSVFLRFQGGKGVATAAGTVAVLLPIPTGFAILAFAATILAGQIMSISSIAGACVLAISQLSISKDIWSAATAFAFIAAALVIVRHRSNISRLMQNSESRLKGLKRFAFSPAYHVLALGLWFGAGWFFSLGIATQLFSTFNELAKLPPDWLPLADEPVKELGNRLAGTAVGPIFPRYFLLQAICGVIATGAAIGWAVRYRYRINKIYALLLTVGLLLVAIGWPVNRIVSDLRMARYESESARAAFASWHFVSLFLNLGTLLVITPAMAMSPYLIRIDEESPTVANM